MEDCNSMFILTLFLALITVLFSATDPNDVNILNNLINDLENPEILRWPPASDDADPCGPPAWNHLICNGNRASQILANGLNLKGPLPHNLNQLAMLTHLRFENNQLTGPLPSFKGLVKLQIASFGNNSFDLIPADFLHGLKDLQSLALDHNNYNASGGWSFPSDLQNSVQLTNLSCMNCNLVGSLPHFLGDLSCLKSLKLSGNNLSGEIPANLNDEEDNRLTGSIVGSIPMFEAAKVGCSHGATCSLEIKGWIGSMGGFHYHQRFVTSWWDHDPCANPGIGAKCSWNQKASVISVAIEVNETTDRVAHAGILGVELAHIFGLI